MSRNLVLLFLALCVLLVVISTLAATSVSAKRGNLPNYDEVDMEQFKKMPDPENDDDAAELGCNACALSVQFMKDAMEKVKTRFARQPHKLKESHALEALDGLCKKHALKVGLLAHTSDSSTKQFVHEDDARRAGGSSVLKGGWITRFFLQKCDDMVTEAEDNMKEMMLGRNIDLCPDCKKAEKVEKKRKAAEEAAKKRKNSKKSKNSKKNEDL